MDASSRLALDVARERLTGLTRPAPGVLGRARDAITRQPRVSSEAELRELAGELFAVGRVLDDQPTLRRALSDPAGSPDDRAALAERLFRGKISGAALDVVETVARQRWSRPSDLVDAMTILGTEAALDACPGSCPTARRRPGARSRCSSGCWPARSARSPSCCCATC
jgi:F-type H+-transporting ATPase subunit delta